MDSTTSLDSLCQLITLIVKESFSVGLNGICCNSVCVLFLSFHWAPQSALWTFIYLCLEGMEQPAVSEQTQITAFNQRCPFTGDASRFRGCIQRAFSKSCFLQAATVCCATELAAAEITEYIRHCPCLIKVSWWWQMYPADICCPGSGGLFCLISPVKSCISVLILLACLMELGFLWYSCASEFVRVVTRYHIKHSMSWQREVFWGHRMHQVPNLSMG